MEQKINNYKNWLKVNGKADSTIKSYSNVIIKFFKVNTEMTKETIEKFLLQFQGKINNKTINIYRKAIKSYLDYLDINIRLPKNLPEIEILPDAISLEKFEDEIIPIVELSFNNPDKVIAIFYLIFFTGLRPSEISALKRTDIDFKNHRGKVFRKKVNNWHIFPLHEVVIYHLTKYFMREPEIKNAFNISASGIQSMTYKLKKDFPNINLRPYLFRHSLATHLFKKKFNLIEIQKMLGHKSIVSTEKYVHVDVDDLIDHYLTDFKKVKERKDKYEKKLI